MDPVLISTIGNAKDTNRDTLFGILGRADYQNQPMRQVKMNGSAASTLLNITGSGAVTLLSVTTNSFVGSLIVDGTTISLNTSNQDIGFGPGYLYIPFKSSLRIDVTSGNPGGAWGYVLN